MVYGIEEQAKILFLFEGNLGISFEFVKVNESGVNFVKDLTKLNAIRELFEPTDRSLI